RAARLRDQITSVRKVIERQQMVGAREEDYDCIGIAEDALEASVQVFFVRKGRVVGRKGLVVDKVEELSPPALVGRILEQLYGGRRAAPARRPAGGGGGALPCRPPGGCPGLFPPPPAAGGGARGPRRGAGGGGPGPRRRTPRPGRPPATSSSARPTTTLALGR